MGKRGLSHKDLKAMGVTPGLLTRRIDQSGKSTITRLTQDTKPGRPDFFGKPRSGRGGDMES